MRRLGPRLEDEEDLVQQDERGPEREAHHERRPHGRAVASSEGAPEEKAGQALPDDDAREQDRAQPGRHADLGRAGRDEGQVPRDPGPVRRQDVKGPEQVGQVGERHDGEVEAPESQEHGREEPEIEPGSPPERSRGPWASSSARLYAGAGAARAGRDPPWRGCPGLGYLGRRASASEPMPGGSTSVKRTLERELKLDVEPGFRLPSLPGRPLAPRTFISRYYDTPDHRLARRGVTLRCRIERAPAPLAGQAAAGGGAPRAGGAGLVVPAARRARAAPSHVHAGRRARPHRLASHAAGRASSCATGGGRWPRWWSTRWPCSTGSGSSGASARSRSSSSARATPRTSSASPASCARRAPRRARAPRRCSERSASTSPSRSSPRARPATPLDRVLAAMGRYLAGHLRARSRNAARRGPRGAPSDAGVGAATARHPAGRPARCSRRGRSRRSGTS